MQIKKSPGPERLVPDSNVKAQKKPAVGGFDKALEKVLKSSKIKSAAGISEESTDKEKLKTIKNRIEGGFYNRPEVISDIADRLINKGKSS